MKSFLALLPLSFVFYHICYLYHYLLLLHGDGKLRLPRLLTFDCGAFFYISLPFLLLAAPYAVTFGLISYFREKRLSEMIADRDHQLDRIRASGSTSMRYDTLPRPDEPYHRNDRFF